MFEGTAFHAEAFRSIPENGLDRIRNYRDEQRVRYVPRIEIRDQSDVAAVNIDGDDETRVRRHAADRSSERTIRFEEEASKKNLEILVGGCYEIFAMRPSYDVTAPRCDNHIFFSFLSIYIYIYTYVPAICLCKDWTAPRCDNRIYV